MKTYNRALDFTVLALSQLTKGNSVMAARLMAKAVQQKDIRAAIATLEASNKHAYSLRAKALAKTRFKASDDFPIDDDMDDDMDGIEDGMDGDEDMVENAAFEDGDEPLDEMEDEDDGEDEDEDSPSETMAKVLSRMVRRSGKR